MKSLAIITLQFSVEIYTINLIKFYISDQFIGFALNLIGYFQLRK